MLYKPTYQIINGWLDVNSKKKYTDVIKKHDIFRTNMNIFLNH